MGICHSEESKNINVATLNYSGILLSPFQFYSTQSKQQLSQISQIFRTIISKNNKTNLPNFKWNIGSIDKKIQQKRYSPIYKKGAGVQNGKILSRDQFKNKWNAVFTEAISQSQKFIFTEQQKQNMFLFDLICFESLILFVYQSKSWDKIVKQSPKKYLEFCEKSFNKSFLKNQVKLDKTLKAMQRLNLDIIFLQQTNEILMKQLEKQVKTGRYFIKDAGNDSVILIKTQKFKDSTDSTSQMSTKLSQQQIKRLNWNNDTTLMFFDNLILISSHISANQTKNVHQMNQVYQDLSLLAIKFPQHKIILGFDANNKKVDSEYITPQIPSDFKTIPEAQSQFTLAKKRTNLQVQWHKADNLTIRRSDYIVTNAKVVKSQICTIQGRVPKIEQELLPSDEHPFDHLVVLAHLKLQ